MLWATVLMIIFIVAVAMLILRIHPMHAAGFAFLCWLAYFVGFKLVQFAQWLIK